MNRNLLLIAVAALALTGLNRENARALNTTNGLISTFSIVGVYAPTNDIVQKTNTIGNVVTSTLAAKPFTMNNKSILNLLEAEFGTQFPSGAQLAVSFKGTSFVVVDSHGGLALDAATNASDPAYRFVLTNTVTNSEGLLTGKTVMTTLATSTNSVSSLVVYASDFGVFYADGKGNNFHFTGVLTERASSVDTSSNSLEKSLSSELVGLGGGTVYNPADGHYDPAVFTRATLIASGSNFTNY